MLPDDRLDALLREARPRAGAGFEAAVMSRLGRSRRRRWVAAAGIGVAAAAVCVLWMTRPDGRGSGWTQAGRELREGAVVAGPAELRSGARAASIGGAVRVGRDALTLESGAATLRGGEVVARTAAARVTTLTPDTEVEVEMPADANASANAKMKTGAAVVAAAGAAVLTVYVVHGAARVDTAAPPSSKVLAAGDYALAPPNRTPFVARARVPQPGTPPLAMQVPPEASASAAAKHAGTKLDAPRPQSPPIQPPAQAVEEAESQGHLDKTAIRETIQKHILELRFCYEQEAAKNPNLSGRIVMSFVIREKEGAGRVDDAEIIPGDSDESRDLNSPRVEHCVLSALARWHFPVPEGGGSVHVRYPIEFEQRGQDPPP